MRIVFFMFKGFFVAYFGEKGKKVFMLVCYYFFCLSLHRNNFSYLRSNSSITFYYSVIYIFKLDKFRILHVSIIQPIYFGSFSQFKAF